MTLNRIKQGLHLLPFIGICVAFAHSNVQAQPNTTDSFRLELQLGHTKTITHLDFSKDSNQLVSSSQDESIKVWDIKTGRLLRTLDGHQAHVQRAEYSPDNGALVSVSLEPETQADTMVKRWDALKGELVQAATWLKRRGQRLDLWSFAWAKEAGHIITAGAMDEVSIWNTLKGERLARLSPSQNHRSSDPTAKAQQVIVLSGGSYAVSGHSGGSLVVWDLKAQNEVSRTSQVHQEGVSTLTQFQDDKENFISLSGKGRVRHWRLEKSILQIRKSKPIEGQEVTAVVAGTGQGYFTGHANGAVKRWGSGRNGPTAYTRKGETGVEVLALSDNGQLLAAAFSDHVIRIWDVSSNALVQTIRGKLTDVWSLAVAPNQTSMIMGTGDAAIHVWNLETGSVLKTLTEHKRPIGVLTFSPDGQQFLSAGAGGKTAPALAEPEIRLWSTQSWDLIHTFNQAFPVGVSFSDEGRKVVAGGAYMGGTGFTVWKTDDGAVLHKFKMCQARSDMSQVCDLDGFVVGREDGGLLTKRGDSSIRGWSLEDGSLRFQNNTQAKVNPRLKKLGGKWSSTLKLLSGAKLSSRDRRHRVWGGGMSIHSGTGVFALGSQDKTVKLYGWKDGKELKSLKGHQGWVRSTSFSADGKKLVSGGEDKRAIVWDTSGGKPIAHLEGHVGAVWDADFSAAAKFVWTSSADGTVRLWNADKGELLATLVAGVEGDWAVTTPLGHFDANDLETIESIHWVRNNLVAPLESFMRDYYEPKLLSKLLAGESLRPVKDINRINTDSPKVAFASIKPSAKGKSRVDVTLELTNPQGHCEADNGAKHPNGVFDVRLFRNRKMVAYKDGRVEANTVVFRGVHLPMNGTDKVNFSAYAFNCDQVKSRTVFDNYHFEKPRNVRPGQTYVISMGVNSFESSQWNLRYAVNDAKLFQKVLPEAITGPQANKAVALGLYSELSQEGTIILPTKENLEIIFEVLGGKPKTQRIRKRYPWIKNIEAALPRDRVIVTFATHGFRTKDGGFYLFPSDTGTSPEKGGLPALGRLISAKELERWFRDIDAGEFLMVIDACNSAASVQQPDFRPGPMGSRGLGQLAYNKGMRIIAASQGNKPAKEDASLQHGLLTYAMVQEGIQAQWADHAPKDGVLTLEELLAYASTRVPLLDTEARRGRIKRLPAGASSDRGLSLMVNRTKKKKPQPTQQPQVFDFVRNNLEWNFKPVKP